MKLDRAFRTVLLSCSVLLALAGLAVAGDPPLRVFLRGGAKTHGENEHEHERWVGAWKALLAERGATVDGALVFPTSVQLEATDVMVMYCAEGGSIHGDERARLEKFLARGGGLVVLHDAVCGDDPQWWKTVIGGAWEHGHSKWKNGDVGVCFQDFDHPITRTAANFTFEDELYYELHMTPDAHVLATGYRTIFDFEPQMWTVEKDKYRAFVSIQGHLWKSFDHPAWRTLLLRAIAWSGKRDVDLLTNEAERRDLAYPPGGPTRPELASRGLEVQDGFELSLVAAEPLIVKPISLDWDPSGRMWVAETPGYPEKAQFSKIPPHDRIAVLSDSDGDGRMDKSTTFCDGLDLVTSFVFHQNGVIASAAPDIWFLQDDDGDGKCDARTKLFTGFGFGDTHAVVSNLRRGLDGWIYATQGYSGNASDVYGPDALGKKHFGRIGNGIFRFKPDGSAIEMVSSYGSNTWGLDFTPEGDLLFSMANGAHLRHVVLPEKALAGGRLPRTETWNDIADHDRVFPLLKHEEPLYAQIDFVGGFTAASGCCMYDGGAWPPPYSDACFVTEPTVHLVHVDVLQRDGVSFKAVKQQGAEEREFLAGKDPWFRPVHTRVGPDGALYVLDFYNQAVVHNDTRGTPHGPTNAALRPDRDHQHGRIWRVQHARAMPIAQRKLAGATQGELVAALANQNGWTRTTAQRLLCEAPELTAREALEGHVRRANNPRAAIGAMWVLDRFGIAPPEEWREAHAVIRRSAWSLPTVQASSLASDAIGNEPDARTRLMIAASSARGGSSAPLVRVFAEAGDPWTRSAILSRATAAPAQFLRDAFASADVEKLKPLIDGIADAAGRARKIDDVAAIVAVLADHAERGAIVASALERLGARLQSDAPRAPDALVASLRRLLGSSDVDVAIAALPLAVKFDADGALAKPIEELGAKLGQQLRDRNVPTTTRTRALRALFGMPARRAEAIAAAETLFGPSEIPELRTAAIDELGRAGDDASGVALARAFGALSGTAREQALSKLVARANSANALLAEVEAARVKPGEIGTRGVSELRNHADGNVAKRANAVFDRLQGVAPNIEALIAKLEPDVSKPGDVARGAAVFKQNCANCHAFRGEGGKVGPDLTGIGTHGVRELLPIVLDPNRTVEAAYLEYVAETKDELIVTGVLVRDTAQSIVLRSATGDAEVSRDDLASLKSTGRSPMPAGFETIGAEGLRDLFTFLASGFEGFRMLDLRTLVNASTRLGMYDTRRDANPMELVTWGPQEIEGVPFDVLDPAKRADSKNVVVLRGGRGKDWESKFQPQRVEVPLGALVKSVHVLGGIAAWGHPCTTDKRPIAK